MAKLSSLFIGGGVSADTGSSKSPRSFGDGAVGLGIVAAMINNNNNHVECVAPKYRSEPIPIVKKGAGVVPTAAKVTKEDEEELSESYTCVISHVGGGCVRKRVYFHDDGGGGIGCNYEESSMVFFESPPPLPVMWGPPVDFLTSCYLCGKCLHGIDIFMYRGEKAFCSAECRSNQILSDERKEKYRSGAGKSVDSAVSCYPATLLFDIGMAAA